MVNPSNFQELVQVITPSMVPLGVLGSFAVAEAGGLDALVIGTSNIVLAQAPSPSSTGPLADTGINWTAVGTVLSAFTAFLVLAGAAIKLYFDFRSPKREQESRGRLQIDELDGPDTDVIRDKAAWNRKRRQHLWYALVALSVGLFQLWIEDVFFVILGLLYLVGSLFYLVKWISLTITEGNDHPWSSERQLLVLGSRDQAFNGCLDALRSVGAKIQRMSRWHGWIVAYTGQERSEPANWGERLYVTMVHEEDTQRVTVGSESVSTRGSTRNRDNVNNVISRLIK